MLCKKRHQLMTNSSCVHAGVSKIDVKNVLSLGLKKSIHFMIHPQNYKLFRDSKMRASPLHKREVTIG